MKFTANILLPLVAIALLGQTQAFAQKVVNTGNKRAVLDCSKETSMLQSAVTFQKKYTSNKTANNTSFILGSYEQSQAANTLIYYKLELASGDLMEDGTAGLGYQYFTWAQAYNLCKQYNGGGWRLPTHREMVMIYIFKDAFNEITTPNILGYKNSDSGSVSVMYWTATETPDPTKARVLDFYNETFDVCDKNIVDVHNRKARCVKEL